MLSQIYPENLEDNKIISIFALKLNDTDMNTMMRQAKRWMLTALLAIGGATASAQTFEFPVYVWIDEMPDAGYFLPAPPSIGSVEFIDDLVQFQWGKTQRNTPRGQQASRESMWEPEAMRIVIAEALSLDEISDEKTPALATLLDKCYYTGNLSTVGPKDKYMRVRPFVQMNDQLWAEYDDDLLRTNGSYPSGHTAFSWFTALAVAEMWPALQDTILRRGFLFGENRVIAGAHYQSDVTAGYLCAAAAFARAHTNPELQEDIKAARAEYARLKGLDVEKNTGDGVDVPHGENILSAPVDTASYRYASDLALYWAGKELRDTERGSQAEHEADYSVEMMCEVFGEATGVLMSQEKTPNIYALMSYVLDKSSAAADRLKEIRFRKRPFVQLDEPSFVAGDEEKERGKSSFPSGHTNLGWTEALTMVQVAPEHQDEILRRGYEYGYNRQIVGYHWFTDIVATRQLSSALFARLNADAKFQELMKKAQKEYQSIAPTGVRSVTRSDADGQRAAIYTIDGRRIDGMPTRSGIYIQGNKKVLR